MLGLDKSSAEIGVFLYMTLQQEKQLLRVISCNVVK